MNVADENKLMRRVAGYHDLRLDGITDLVLRARGATVMDIGCNRGLVGFEMANNGARVVHGCDNYAEGIETARQIFIDLRNVESQFEVVDLTLGPVSLKPFALEGWDIVLFLATYHKLKRVMSGAALSELVQHVGKRTKRYFAWRGTSEKADENHGEMADINRDLGKVGLTKVHTSSISLTLGAAAIWARL